MPWVYKAYTDWVRGKKVTHQKRVWVAPPVKKKSRNSSVAAAAAARRKAAAAAAARRRAAAASARRKAAAAAARRRAAQSLAASRKRHAEAAARRNAAKLQQKHLAEARRKAYEELKRRQQDLIEKAGLYRNIANARPKPGKPTAPVITRPSQIIPGRKTPAQARSEEAARARGGKDSSYWTAYREYWQKKSTMDNFKAGNSASALQVEATLQAQRDKALRTGASDTKYLTKLHEQYEKHATAVYSAYEKMVAKVNGALDKGDSKAARRVLESDDFKAMQREFTRLFGSGKDPLHEGSYNEFQKGFQDISNAQRDWWKRQMKALLPDRISQLKKLSHSKPGLENSPQLELMEQQLDYLNGKNLPKVVDHYERVKGPNGKESYRPVYRDATLEEALQTQYARIKMMQEQAVAERLRQESSAKSDAIKHGMSLYKGQWVNRKHRGIAEAIDRLQQRGENVDARSSADVQRMAGSLLDEWTRKNPPPPANRANQGPRRDWQARRDAYEKDVYGFFGSSVPGFLERAVEFPGVSQALSLLQAGNSSIGAGGRVLAKVTTGTSTLELNIPLDQLPAEVRAAALRGGGANQLPFGRSLQGKGLINDPVTAWLRTAEGQAWYAAHKAELAAESQKEDEAFAQGFYGNGDLGQKVQALNEYGAEPFSDDVQNLMFQLLADPTNAIPLKFTTYLARGKYAAEAIEGSSKLKSLVKAPHAFLSVDEGTLGVRAQLRKFKDEIKAAGMTEEQALDLLRERVAGIKGAEELKSAVNDWATKLGINSKKVSESQLFSLAEQLAVRKAGDEAIPLLTQADEFNEASKLRAAALEAAEKDATEAARKGTQDVNSRLARRRARGTTAREKLNVRRTEQEESLRAIAEKKATQPAPKPVVKVDPPARDPNVSGASDNHVSAKETKAVSKQVRSQPKARYQAEDEFYKSDSMGNRIPIDYVPDEDYRKLVKAAREGNADAREQLVNRARYERNRFRMEQEDLPLSTRKRDVKFRVTKFDLAERAGTVGDEVATERLIRDRKTLRFLKRVAGSGSADDTIRGYTRPYRTRADRHPLIEGGRGSERTTLDEYGDLQGQVVSNRIAIGDDIIEARETTARGLKDLYQPFSHTNSAHYPGLADLDLKKMTYKQFTRVVKQFSDMPIGAGSYRDGGQALFEVFHQLRLTKDWDKLREFSDYMTVVLRDDETNVFAWMWKTMEERSVLPYSMHVDDIRSGFYSAAEAWNLHPELAFAAIPSGYYARTPPVTFGLTARLQGALESTNGIFKAPPRGYTKKMAKQEITRIFMGRPGEATRVLLYVAESFGDFFKYSEMGVRLSDELTHAAALSLGPEALADILIRYPNAFSDKMITLAAQAETPLVDVMTRLIDTRVNKWGRNIGEPRPDYAELRNAVNRAYADGLLKDLPGEAHTMMFLRNVQTNPDAYVQHIRLYKNYMERIGHGSYEQAKALVHTMYEGEIRTDITRMSAEREGRAAYKDAISGKPVPAAQYDRAKLWEEMGFTPSIARLDAYATRRAENADGLERQFARDKEREVWLREGSEDVRGDYTGTVDTTDFVANVKGLVDDIRGGSKEAPEKLEQVMTSFMRRMVDTGAANLDQESLNELRNAVEAVTGSGQPEANRILLRVQEELGFQRLGATLAASPDPLAWKEAVLRAQLRHLEDANGTVKKGFEQAHTQAQTALEEVLSHQKRVPGSHRIDLDAEKRRYQAEAEMRAESRAEDGPQPDDPEPHGVPSDEAATRSRASQVYDHIFKMNETEWMAFERDRANRVLRSKASSPRRKADARAHLKDIDAAEFTIKTEKSRGTYVPWRERASYANKVTERYGGEAEELFAPKAIAPYVTSAADASVEQGRSLWRLLQSAAKDTVQSTVRGISHKGEAVDHMPKGVWDELEQSVSDAIAEARGWRANTRTASHGRGKVDESRRPVGKLSDKDPLVIRAKQQALGKFRKETGWNISIDAYDEARKVLRKAHVQYRTSLQLLARAEAIVARSGGDVGTVYNRLRVKAAKVEARRQLSGLAYGEMFGHDPETVMASFTSRYGDDGMLRSFTPELSPFQKKTLEEHVKSISLLDELDDRIGIFLQSANRPPFESRELTRDFLTRIGAWAPRSSEDFATGARSWSVAEEARYWRNSYGEVPEWTDEAALGTEFKQIFHDEDLYFKQMKSWGIFSRSQELKLRVDGHSAKEIEDAVLNGNPELGIKGRREIALQRKYVIERYGKLVSEDGHSLDAMPWLMSPEELSRYLARQPAGSLPEGLIQSTAELDEVTALIEKVMQPYFEKYVLSKVRGGEQVSYHDMFRVASEVQAQLLANPKWARRYRDIVGDVLNRWAWFNRWLVFSNPAFLVTNAVDVPIKGLYYRFTRRAFFNQSSVRAGTKAAERAAELNPVSLGLDATTAMYRVKQAKAIDRFVNPRGYSDVERAIDRALAVVDGTGEVFPTIAGRAELRMKMELARGMYPNIYERAFKELGSDELADAFAKKFIHDEVNKMWPTAGDGPIERLWNKFVPFASYSVRNKLLFIGEAFAHPAILNYIDHIGDFIEEENLKDWDKRHPGVEMPEHLRRRVSLPWAPDYYLDLSTFSDAARGLKPIFDMAEGSKSALDWTSQWVRLVNPGIQAGVYMLFNAYNLFPKTGYIAILDANGYPTGEYQRVTVPWTEPWSKDQPDVSSVFWFSEALQTAADLGVDGWTAGEISQMFGQVAFFNGISTFDRGSTFNSFYFSLKDKNPEAAKAFLMTDNGKYLQDWWEDRANDPREVMNAFKDLEKKAADPAPWFHDQSKEFQQKVKDGRDLISDIRETFAAKLETLEPGTALYKETKARMYWAINDVYLRTPEMLKADVWGKTAAQWGMKLEDWETDKLMDDFMALNKQKPNRSDFNTAKGYNKAVGEWQVTKQTFLAQYPQVAARLNEGRQDLDLVRRKMEEEWDKVFKRISTRNEQIEAAKKVDDRDKLDMLYLAQQLDYSLLERDYAGTYFSPEDHEALGKGILGPSNLRDGLLARAETLLDFDRRRYEKAVKDGKGAEFLAENKYQNALRAAALKAKGGDPLGKFDPIKFVRAVQGDPYLKAQYYKRNPDKAKKWMRTDSYIKNISVWGKLAGAGRWDEAQRVWNNLPDWVKQEYFARNPDSKMRTFADGRRGSPFTYKGQFFKSAESRQRFIDGEKKHVNTAQYLGYMQKWVKMFESGDGDAAMEYFDSLPKWAKERYYQKHPGNRMKFEEDAKMDKKLRDYFAGRKEDRAVFLKDNPDLGKFLANSGGKDGEYFAIQQAYRSIPKEEAWLRRIFRERYPEVFSAEAAGERRLRRVYDTLASHPDVLPEFEQWVEAIWSSYEQMLKSTHRPVSWKVKGERKVPARKYKRSLSAAEARNITG